MEVVATQTKWLACSYSMLHGHNKGPSEYLHAAGSQKHRSFPNSNVARSDKWVESTCHTPKHHKNMYHVPCSIHYSPQLFKADHWHVFTVAATHHQILLRKKNCSLPFIDYKMKECSRMQLVHKHTRHPLTVLVAMPTKSRCPGSDTVKRTSFALHPLLCLLPSEQLSSATAPACTP